MDSFKSRGGESIPFRNGSPWGRRRAEHMGGGADLLRRRPRLSPGVLGRLHLERQRLRDGAGPALHAWIGADMDGTGINPAILPAPAQRLLDRAPPLGRSSARVPC